jgi:hypothetical protein
MTRNFSGLNVKKLNLRKGLSRVAVGLHADLHARTQYWLVHDLQCNASLVCLPDVFVAILLTCFSQYSA